MSPASCVSLPEGRGTGLYAGTSQKPHRLCAIGDRHLQTVFALCSGLRWGRPRKGEAFTPSEAPPPPRASDTQLEAEGLVNLAPRRSFCGSLGSFLEFLEACLEGLQGLCGARRKWSPGFAAWDPRACRAAFRPCLPPWSQPCRGAPGSLSENKGCGFSPRLKSTTSQCVGFFFFFPSLRNPRAIAFLQINRQ